MYKYNLLNKCIKKYYFKLINDWRIDSMKNNLQENIYKYLFISQT